MPGKSGRSLIFCGRVQYAHSTISSKLSGFVVAAIRATLPSGQAARRGHLRRAEAPLFHGRARVGGNSSLSLGWYWQERGPLRLRSGQAFDCAADSLRESATSLRMTGLVENFRICPDRSNSVYALEEKMRMQFSKLLAFAILIAIGVPLSAQQQAPAPQAPAAAKPEDTEGCEPEPNVVTPGANNAAPPSDAIILFDGKNLDEWVSAQDKSPAKWRVARGVLTVNKAAGN